MCHHPRRCMVKIQVGEINKKALYFWFLVCITHSHGMKVKSNLTHHLANYIPNGSMESNSQYSLEKNIGTKI